jgi:cholesterol oxidase
LDYDYIIVGSGFGGSVKCRYDAKNTHDKNYLYLAQKHGVTIQAEAQVYDIIPFQNDDGGHSYKVRWKSSTSFFKKKGEFTCSGIILAAGVLGSVGLLLNLKRSSLPNLSEKIGYSIRTNSESLIGITTYNKNIAFSEGVAIGSKLRTDQYTHLEPVRYPSGSGFWRLLMSPLVQGNNIFIRIFKLVLNLLRYPLQNWRIYFVWNWAKRTQILLFMQTLDSTFKFPRNIVKIKSR